MKVGERKTSKGEMAEVHRFIADDKVDIECWMQNSIREFVLQGFADDRIDIKGFYILTNEGCTLRAIKGTKPFGAQTMGITIRPIPEISVVKAEKLEEFGETLKEYRYSYSESIEEEWFKLFMGPKDVQYELRLALRNVGGSKVNLKVLIIVEYEIIIGPVQGKPPKRCKALAGSVRPA